jgi:CheY-like chemotaxis protein
MRYSNVTAISTGAFGLKRPADAMHRPMQSQSAARLVRQLPARGDQVQPPATVLHVDDDPNDTVLLRAASRAAQSRFMLHNVEDSEQAIAYLSGQGKYCDRSTYQMPCLILLDLRMPRATGFELLSWIRAHPEVGSIPVVVLSGSELAEDVQKAYARGANSYLVKPLGFEALVAMVRTLETTWVQSLPC